MPMNYFYFLNNLFEMISSIVHFLPYSDTPTVNTLIQLISQLLSPFYPIITTLFSSTT